MTHYFINQESTGLVNFTVLFSNTYLTESLNNTEPCAFIFC
jgi:hypothetical protein